MLVLSRKVGERVLLGDNIRITIVRVSGGGVRLGIEAPSDVAVVREEVSKSDFTKSEVGDSTAVQEVVVLDDSTSNGAPANATHRRRPK